MGRKHVIGAIAWLLALAAAFPAGGGQPGSGGQVGSGGQAGSGGREGDWELADNGKWTYCTRPGEPVKDEWLTVDGRTYYLDSSGYMKTGWVKNREDGLNYYMGEDGAMRFNTFAPDGRYAGPDGSDVTAYDSYRKKAKTELKKAGNTRWARDAATAGRQPAFLAEDLNGDGYRDLVVKDSPEGHVALVKVWDPEDSQFLDAAKFDVPDPSGGGRGDLYREPLSQAVWLEISGADGSLDQFRLEEGGPRFEHVGSYRVDIDGWGGALYLSDGDSIDRESWERAKEQAMAARGQARLEGFLPLTEEAAAGSLDLVLAEAELVLWEE